VSGGRAEAGRLALCGNVFPGDALEDVLAALRGPVASWAARVRRSGGARRPGFGLYLGAGAAAQVAREPAAHAELARALDAAGVEVWTANAFPFGGFHGAKVKERAFQPDWTTPERLQFTLDVAAVLAALMPRGARGSLSSCPLGYGPAARAAPAARANLRVAQEALLALERERGVVLVLALEPEPDGGFETVPELAAWLDREVLDAIAATDRRIGVCWDLCHSAVVGERAGEVLASLRKTGVPLGKVQVSAALQVEGEPGPEARSLLEQLSADPWFHQVRGRHRDGRVYAAADLPAYLAEATEVRLDGLRVHCHVPVHREAFGGGLVGTPWRPALAAAWRAGVRDFEVETYTLPVLPPSFLEEEGLVGTLAAETNAVLAALAATASQEPA